MNEVKEATRNLVSALKTERDDLRVQLKLASAELRQRAESELSKLDAIWADLKLKGKQLGSEVETVSSALQDDIEEITGNLSENSAAMLDELRDGYKRIRESLKR